MLLQSPFVIPESSLPAVDFTVPSPQDTAEALGFGNFMGWTAAAIGALVGIIVLLKLIRLVLRTLKERAITYDRVVLQVLMPKEAEAQAEKQEGAEKKKDLKEVIAVAESMYANLAGIKRPRTWGYTAYKLRKWLFGDHNHITMEIVALKGLVKFFVVVRRKYREQVEQQIHAQFPTAFIAEVEDYNIFTPHARVRGTYLKTSKDPIFPLKTFKELDSDPMDAITNALSKIKENEGAAIQLLIRPAHEHWRSHGMKLARELHRGKKLEEVMTEESRRGVTGFIIAILEAPLKGVVWLFEQATSSEKDRQHRAQEEKEKKSGQAPVRIFQREEELIKKIEEKFSKSPYECNLRIVVSSPDDTRTFELLRTVAGAFAQFTAHEIGMKLQPMALWNRQLFFHDFIHRSFREWKKCILSTGELASIYHFPLPTAETPNIEWLLARAAAPPFNLPAEGLVMGKSIYRGEEKPIRIKREDRRRHVYIIGKSGVGKSVLLANMAKQDIANGEGVCVIDPHGDLIEDILAAVPRSRIDDVIVFDPSDVERPVGLNMLEVKAEEQKDFAVQEMISIFYKLFPPEMIGPMFEHNMRNVMLTLMSDKADQGTIAEIPRMFSDNEYQKYWVAKVKDPIVRAFWEKEMAKTSDFHKSEMLGYLISKVGRFVENEMMRNIIGQIKSGFDIREVMDKKKVLLVNLSKGRTGEVNANLLGLIIVSKLQMAALSRADLPEAERHDFYLYIDEFQNFITDSIATILSEARKYRLNLIIAHQYMGQLVEKGGQDTKIRDAVLGNAGTMMCFRIGIEDAEVMAKEFAPTFNEYDLVNAEKYTAYLKLLIDNQASRPFTMQTVPPEKGDIEVASAIKELSRLRYGRDKFLVEQEIIERTRLGEAKEMSETATIERSL